ncbi:MAG: cytochrome c [Chloroflexi bacterium]|nr:cytochrome c [Chloroflexota bacterium]
MSQQNDSNNQSNQFGHAAGAIMVVLFIVIIMMIAQESAGVSVAALPRPGFKSPTPTVTSTPTETPMPTATFTPAPTEQPTTEPDANAGASYDPALIAEGESQFILCAACHGLDGRGVPNLGKDLVESEFVAGLTDQKRSTSSRSAARSGIPPTRPASICPQRGGNPAMTDDQILAVIAYIRSLGAGAPQDAPAEQPATEIPATDVPPTEQPAAQPTAAPDAGSSTSYDPALIAEGESQFILCAACHGMDGHGVPNLGKDLVNSEFVAGLTDQETLDSSSRSAVRSGIPPTRPASICLHAAVIRP